MKIILSGLALLAILSGCASYGGPERYGEGTRMVDGRMEGDHMDTMGPKREDRGGHSGRDTDSGY